VGSPHNDAKKAAAEAPRRRGAATQVPEEYMTAGAVTRCSPSSLTQTGYLVPWFLIRKLDASGKPKVRLITDCREINRFLHPQPFRLDHWQHIFPVLRKDMWGVKVDLQHAYFHLELNAKLKPYVRIQVGQEVFQFEAACFGLSTLPQQWMTLMKVLQKYLRAKGLLLFIYLDDILLVSQSKALLVKQTKLLLTTLEKSGLTVNTEKSQMEPAQVIPHLGFVINFTKGVLEVPSQKLKQIRKELGKVVTANDMSCRKMAAIQGTVRSFLTALPFLRAFTDEMYLFINQHPSEG